MTTILVCADERAVTALDPDTRTVVVDDLCYQLRRIEEWIPDDEDHLVLAVHRSDVDLGSIQSAVRRAGFDPLGVGLVDLHSVATSDDLGFTLAAAAVRSRASSPVPPEQVKLLTPERSTRRALLSIGKQRYVAAPGVDATICRAADGCRVCVDACPSQALSWVRGAVHHDINACVVCGICTTTCPAGAIENPASAADAIEEEIGAAIEHAGRPIGIRFRCRNATVPAEAGWYQVEVPCTAMLTPGWVLAPRLLGAAAVDVVPCSIGGCRFRLDDRTLAMLTDAAAISERLGITGDRHVERPRRAATAGLLRAPATSRVVDHLAGVDAAPLELAVGDLGSVVIDPSTCTACERCATVCPSGALTSARPDGGTVITFDPKQCTACMTCLVACPEIARGAISVRRQLDVADRARGRRIVREEQLATCEICGRPVAPVAMLARIEAMLGDDAGSTMPGIGRRCLDCRGR